MHFSAFCYSFDANNRLHVDAGDANEVILQCMRDPSRPRPRSWTFVCAAVGASFRLDGDDAEFGAFTIQPSFVLHGTPLVRDEAARAVNAEAGLLGVAGFAKAAVLNRWMPSSGVVISGGGGTARPSADKRDARDAKDEKGAAGGRAPAARGRAAKRPRGE